MYKAQIKVFIEIHEDPARLADAMTRRVNEWLTEVGLVCNAIHQFQADMKVGQDGENGDALWYCYTITIMYRTYTKRGLHATK